jgi:hypothetical protein
MAPDPNWFYSTLAQSTAAIVGLGGGFLVQRLLQQRNEIAEPRAQLRADLLSSYADISAVRQQAVTVRDSLAGAIEEASRYDRGQFNAFQIRGAVYAFHPRLGTSGQSGLVGTIEFTDLPQFEEARTAAGTLAEALPAEFEDYLDTVTAGGLSAPTDAAWMDEPAAAAPPDTLTDVRHLLPYQRDLARHRWSEAKAIVGRDVPSVTGFRDRLAPRRFYWLLAVIGALLLAGVIVPLLYLTARGGGSKTLLTVPFVILSAAFFAFIGDELRRLRSAGDLKTESF